MGFWSVQLDCHWTYKTSDFVCQSQYSYAYQKPQLRQVYHADLRSSVGCIVCYLQPNPTQNATDVIINKHANRIPNEAVSIFGAGVGVCGVVVVGRGVVL